MSPMTTSVNSVVLFFSLIPLPHRETFVRRVSRESPENRNPVLLLLPPGKFMEPSTVLWSCPFSASCDQEGWDCALYAGQARSSLIDVRVRAGGRPKGAGQRCRARRGEVYFQVKLGGEGGGKLICGSKCGLSKEACFPGVFMYVCMYGQTYSNSMDQPGKVANPARGQLNREI